tara:strand:+ start:2611 stop:5100 length:2490 start_codon:yes stop_codon:yes gene_type:complete
MALPPDQIGGDMGALSGLDLSGLMGGDAMGDAMGGGMMDPLAMAEEPADLRQAPTFPDPEPLKYSEEEQDEIAEMCVRIFEDGIIAREVWAGKHKMYDQMFRGQVEEFAQRQGPWPGSSHLHVQMPYWLTDALNARLVHTMWAQSPLVQAVWEENDDQEVAKDAAQLVEWHLQPKRANAREMWSRASKIRLIHGNSVSLVSYVHDRYKYRVVGTPLDEDLDDVLNPDGTPQFDDLTGEPIRLPGADASGAEIAEGTQYRGPVIYPLEWDDVVAPIGCMNLQPLRLKNPGGADWVYVRHFETLSQMRKKEAAGTYAELFANGRDDQWWIDNASDQTRAGQTEGGGQNNARTRLQDNMEGINRSQSRATTPESRQNPEFEILTYYGSYLHPDTGEDEEMVFFVSKNPRIFLGGFLLTDLVWTGDRPLLEMHYQTISNRFYSMGVMEIVQHLSEELDTIHNMRVDVGTATNLPWYFVRASSYINPNDITLRPLELVPVDDPRDIVAPQVQNVTSFYHQEESLLLTIIERVMGITDLFLGISPTSGASARHATGFLGTKAEAEARLAQPLAQDAESFSFLARLIYNLEMQWGPQERSFRLEGERSSISREGLTRDDLWFRGMYDFRLGANVGMMAQQNRFQRASQAFQFLSQNPLVVQDMGRLWEVSAELLRSMGYREYEIETFIGPHNAVSAGTPKSQDEENAQMIQHVFGPGTPAPITPSDNDQDHMDKIREFLNGPMWSALQEPNAERAISEHFQMHMQAMQQKQMQQQQAMQQQMAGPQQAGAAMPQAADTANRAAAQIPTEGGVSNFAQTYQAQTQGNGMGGGPPQLG